MVSDLIISLSREAVLVTVMASMPAIIASLVIGLLIAIFSATTQIQEQTLSFAPKMLGVYGTLIAFGTPLALLVINFAKACFSQFAHLNP